MTTPQTPHTPFSFVLDECRDAQGAYTLRLADGTANGNTEACPIATVYQDHNAAHIVHCVNTYPALLAALKQARAAFADLADVAGDVQEWNCGGIGYAASQAVKQAITQAEGGTKP